MAEHPDYFQHDHPPLKAIARTGFWLIGVFMGGFLIWALFIPLESAAIAKGKVIVESDRKLIQHLEGGIIKRILVKDGSQVNRGELLMVLDDAQAKAIFNLYQAQVDELLVTAARLIAERDKLDKIQWHSRTLSKQTEPDIQNYINSQQQLFDSNSETLIAQITIYRQRIAQLKEEINSLDAQVVSVKKQMQFTDEELKAVEYLAERKLIDRPRLLKLKRQAAKLQGNLGEYLGLIARAKQKITETEQEIYTLKTTADRDTLKELAEVQTKLAEYLEKENAADEILRRKNIYSPAKGIVHDLQQHTIGGVVQPGAVIMEIVPVTDRMIVEAHIDPSDIDVVKPGLSASVRLLPYNYRATPDLNGKVIQISADTLYDPNNHEIYYKALISIPLTELQAADHIQMYPGMPVIVMITTGKQTFMSYLFSPIRDSFGRAFKEQ